MKYKKKHRYPWQLDCRLCTLYAGKKLGCLAAICPWLSERLQAGSISYAGAIAEVFQDRSILGTRLALLTRRAPPTLWADAQHQTRFELLRDRIGTRRRRDTPSFFAAMYLLTATSSLCSRTMHCFTSRGVDFSAVRLVGISVEDYTLLGAARDLYQHTGSVVDVDLADPELVSEDLFRLIVHANLVDWYGPVILELQNRR